MDNQKIAESLFKHYPSVNVFYITEDGQAFELENNAAAHAASLNAKNPKVETITREKKKVAETKPIEPVEPVKPGEPVKPVKPVTKAAKAKA